MAERRGPYRKDHFKDLAIGFQARKKQQREEGKEK